MSRVRKHLTTAEQIDRTAEPVLKKRKYRFNKRKDNGTPSGEEL